MLYYVLNTNYAKINISIEIERIFKYFVFKTLTEMSVFIICYLILNIEQNHDEFIAINHCCNHSC